MALKLLLLLGYIAAHLSIDFVSGALTETTGCYHNGTIYADKSFVPTLEPCLSCKCNRKTLICSLKVCPEMPVPPPRGCVVVQKKTSCCPYLSCARLDTFFNEPKRKLIAYLDHYERESIDRVVNENMLQRRSDDSDMDTYDEICVQNGTVYKSGSAMSSSSLCTYCYCIGGTQKCVKPKCMLPLEGCKPIFVDSTCCPVRYDCTAKSTGKSSQPNRLRKTSNKHYLRLSQRIQRNRGCKMNDHFYPEGQKMSADADKPCDICFCIRGSRKCAPKKCSPALKNCIPVVPKGQCCPSSYDCGTYKETNRSFKSRQFNLFSYIFGPDDGENITTSTKKDENVVGSEMDKTKMTTTTMMSSLQTNSTSPNEKGFFDTIRESLEFIDKNGNRVGSILETIQPNKSSTLVDHPPINPNRQRVEQIKQKDDEEEEDQGELSLLDLLLATSSPSARGNETNETNSETNDNSTLDGEDTELLFDDISLLDFILGKDENETSTRDYNSSNDDSLDLNDTTANPNETDSTTSTEENFTSEEFSGDGYFDTETTGTEEWSNETTDYTTLDSSNNEDPITQRSESGDFIEVTDDILSTAKDGNDETTDQTVDTLENKPNNHTQIPTTDKPIEMNIDQKIVKPWSTTEILDETTPKVLYEPTSESLKTISEPPTTVIDIKTTTNPDSNDELLTTTIGYNSQEIIKLEHKSETADETEKQNETSTLNKDDGSSGGFLSAFLDGLSDIFEKKNSSFTDFIAPNIRNKTLELVNLNVTLKYDVKSNNTESITTDATIQKETEDGSVGILTPTVTDKPVIVKTNPTILEADLPLDYNEATLPPSLPNLKIIPFLPADAVKTDRKQIVYDFYKPTQFPSITERHTEWKNPHSKMDYDVYDKDEHVPHFDSITEKYTNYGYADIEDQYIDDYAPSKFGAGNNDEDSYVKFEYEVNKNRFSPPTKTEGGFMPKEPIDEQKLYKKYPATKFVIDITSASPISKEEFNLTSVITTEKPFSNPFKDVIKTETPPDLNLLIEDKEKLLGNGISSEYFLEPNEVEDSSNDEVEDKNGEIIHITTDSTYNFTSEYSAASRIPEDNIHNDSNHSKFNAKTNESIVNLTLSKTDSNPIQVPVSVTVLNPNTNPIPSSNFSTLDHIGAGEDYDEDFDLGSMFDFLLGSGTKNNNKTTKNVTIPPFKALPSITAAPEETTTPIFEKKASTNLSLKTEKQKIDFFKDIMFSEHNIPESERYRPIAYKHKLSTKPLTTTHNPFLSAPFNKLPFLDHSIPVKQSEETSEQLRYTPLRSDLDLILPQVSPYNVGSYQMIPDDSTMANTESYVVNPVDVDKLKQHQSEGTAEVFTKPHSSNSLMDHAGILKLAGCNIYGRMYRVGRIISELSGPCLECKCTEVGVNCAPLDC